LCLCCCRLLSAGVDLFRCWRTYWDDPTERRSAKKARMQWLTSLHTGTEGRREIGLLSLPAEKERSRGVLRVMLLSRGDPTELLMAAVEWEREAVDLGHAATYARRK